MKYLIIINPHSGKKLGKKIFDQIKPIFDSNNIILEVIETKHAGHAKELANKKPINQYDGLLGIGGDGTLNEIINGMLKRKDEKNRTKKETCYNDY